ncbi:MAG: class I SAM-dependent RNA methyltransferase [Anaerolineae bacterium]|jgi:23S rRNA (uracil1939-C5)-methyltransferase|nr:class I SAM-dependent RNA methyltransferase [Anaerolineae bacterium]MBT7074512.1 class I SAM-dependent RNA methyltransferase [Anaerolineae bacterium]MBT7781750.1 class I SAM-dependent RNA methyltransferase [Anaerolineae bacterium]
METTLNKFIYGGETMGRLPAPDNRAVFIPYTLPGERVTTELTFQKKGFARGKLLEILEASPERIEAKCEHFTACRACHYQHMPYEAQLRAKEEILKDQLTRLGKIENPPISKIIPSPEIWNYRNQMDFQLGRSPSTPNILEITECHIPAPAINEFWQELEFGENDLFNRITLRQDAAENIMLIFHSENPETPEMTLEDDLSVVHITEGEIIVMGGDDHIITTLHNRPFRVSATSFFHPNTAVAEKMISHLLEVLPLDAETALLELHSGVGSFSAFLAPKVGRLICVENSATACEDFAINLDEFENIALYEAPAMNIFPSLDVTPDIILVDPPASGLGRHTLERMLKVGSSTLAYVASDPSTLARDAKKIISGGYTLKNITPFDIAPQTAQIHSIAIFEKK